MVYFADKSRVQWPKGNKSLIKPNFSAFLGGQARDLLEDTSNLDPCARQTNIRAKKPKCEYTKMVLEATGSSSPKPGN